MAAAPFNNNTRKVGGAYFEIKQWGLGQSEEGERGVAFSFLFTFHSFKEGAQAVEFGISNVSNEEKRGAGGALIVVRR